VQARLALRTNETPVGCVLVYKGHIIAKGMNATNVTRNGTRHAELMAISALLSYAPASDLETAGNNSSDKAASVRMPLSDRTNKLEHEDPSTWGDVDPSDGHLYPYGQKLHPSPRVDKTVINECTLYVTVEPCVMCASLLRQLGIKKVYFGAVNDKFGGTGGVFRIHQNSPYSAASAPPSPRPQYGKGLVRPVLEPRPASTDGQSHVEDDRRGERNVVVPDEPAILPGDGGNVERGFEAEGGWGRDEAVTLLRQFYVQENNRGELLNKLGRSHSFGSCCTQHLFRGRRKAGRPA
jgi:tRNA(Arg) A34 adenosine deaminase TadA